MTAKGEGKGVGNDKRQVSWQPDDAGVDRQLLFSVDKKGSLGGWRAARSCEWKDQEGKLLAVESRGGGGGSSSSSGLELTGELLLAGGPGEVTRQVVIREALL